MKKVLAVMTALVLLSAITACGSSNGNTDNDRASGSQSETAPDEVETSPTVDSGERLY